MGLQNCVKCKSQFNWNKIFISLWPAYRPVRCSQSGTSYFEHKIITN
ncbi:MULTISPECIES: hypothetical protein [Bacillaceae]|nr:MULTISPECIES: hypothetical protein [Bacillaceae]MDF2066731.1 hypothetical protein [Bacillus sp. Cr_A10]